MRSIRLKLATSALLLSLVAAEKCAAPPLSLPYRNVSITPGTLHPGIPLQVGTPYQTIALTPSLQTDDMFLPRYTNTCIYNFDAPRDTNGTVRMNGTKHEAAVLRRHVMLEGAGEGKGDEGWWRCADVYGGAYAPELSSTFVENRTNNQNLHYLSDVWRFTDYLDVYTATHSSLPPKTNLTGTFLLAEKGKTFKGYGGALMGLAPKSTLLEGLWREGVVPSRSWSLSNESLCLGCVDGAAHTGKWHTFKPEQGWGQAEGKCVLQAKVEALNWHPTADVEGATLIQESFTACIDPGVKFLVVPSNATKTFENIAGEGVKAAYDDASIFHGAPGNSTGVLTFRLEGGLEVNLTLPSARTGGEGNWTLPFGTGSWGAYGNSTWVLGKPFTDNILLRWDAEKGEYGIANRNPEMRNPDIQPLGCSSFPSVEKSVTTTPGTGILVGSIVGGFIGGLAFAFAGLWFFKRGQRGVKSKYAVLDEDTVPMRIMSSGGDSWMTGSLSSPPPPSIHESLRGHGISREGPQSGLGLEVADSQLYEAPEGGTAWPTKRAQNEI